MQRGRIIELRASSERPLGAYLYAPETPESPLPLVVSVHGISGNAFEHVARFAPLAARYRAILLAPNFEAGSFDDYQRLGRKGRGPRADLALQKVLTDLAARFEFSGIYLFGFSGGAQFVHRYAMAHPKTLTAYVAGAAGWYTFPDPEVPYPRGISPDGSPDFHFDPAEFLKVPGAVMVGERDIHQGYSLNKSPKIILQQGEHRLERAQRWIAAMNAAAEKLGTGIHYDLVTLPRCNHCFTRSVRRGKMAERVFEWFFEKPAERLKTR